MTEYSNATDLRRRSFLKLLGLAGVAATVPVELLKDPPPAVVEAAHEAYAPVSGDLWVRSSMAPTLARRFGVILSSQFNRNFIDTRIAGGLEEHSSIPTSIDIDLDISPFDMRDMGAIQDMFHNRHSFAADLYLFNKKITFESVIMRQFEVRIPMTEITTVSLGMESTPEIRIEDFAS